MHGASAVPRFRLHAAANEKVSAAEELPPAGVPPEEAIRFFRSKGYAVGFSWLDIFRGEHARVFTVAKAMTRDLLEEIRAAVDDAIANGTTLDTFKKTLRPKLEAQGWWGKKRVIDPATGQMELAQLGSPQRLATIFDTNVRTAYAAGKWERIQRTKVAFPFIEYSSMMDGRERPQHHAWNGTILPVDHPWWDTHYPPCAWRCRCWPIQRSQRMIDRQGKMVTEQPATFPNYTWHNRRTGETGTAEQGIAKGWDYNVGKEYLRGLAPAPLPESFDGADEVGAGAELTNGETALINHFLAAFDVPADKAAIWYDRDGWPLSIGRGWFIAPGGFPRLPKRSGKVIINRIADAIAKPDSIAWVWVQGLDGRALLFRRYQRTSAGITTIADISREGWRWRIGAAEDVAAGYNPHQARDKHGRWSRHGIGAFIDSLALGMPHGSGMFHAGAASPAIAAAIERHTGVTLRSRAIWLEHGRARHSLNKHGGDPVPLKSDAFRHVARLANRADHFELGNRTLHGSVKRVMISARDGNERVHMVFEARRRGLTLHTMYKTKGEVPPA